MDTEEKMTAWEFALSAVLTLGKLAIYAYILLVTIAVAQKAIEALDNYSGHRIRATVMKSR